MDMSLFQLKRCVKKILSKWGETSHKLLHKAQFIKSEFATMGALCIQMIVNGENMANSKTVKQ